MSQITIKVLDLEFKLEEFKLELIPDTLKQWEIGGITDPLGQLIRWLWEQISKAFSWLWDQIWSFITTVRNQIYDFLKSGWDSLVSTFRTIIDGVYRGITGFLDQIWNVLQQVPKFFEEIGRALAQIGTVIQEAVVSAFQTVYNYLTQTAQTIVNSVISGVRTFIDWIVKGIQGLQTLFSEIANRIMSFLQGIVASIQNAFAQVVSFFEQIGRNLASFFTQIQQFITSAFQNVMNFFQGIVSQIMTFFQNIATTISTLFTQISQFITSAFQQLWTGLQGFFSQVMTFFENIARTLSTFFTQIQQFISTAFQNVVASIQGFFSQVVTFFENIGRTLSTLFAQLHQALSSAFQSIINAITSAFQGIQAFFTQIAQTITAGFETIKRFFENLARTIAQFPTMISEFGRWIIDSIIGLGEFIKKSIEGVYQQLQVIGKFLEGFINPLLKIWETLQNTWKWLTQDLPRMVSNLPRMIVESFLALGKQVYDFFMNIGKWFFTGLQTFTSMIYQAFIWIVEQITNLVKTIFKTMLEAFSGIAKSIHEKMRGTSIEEILTAVFDILIRFGFVALNTYMMLDLASITIAGTGVRLDGVKSFVSKVFQFDAIVSGISSAFITAAILTPMQYVINYQYRPRIIDTSTVINAYWRGLIKAEDLDRYFGFHGFGKEQYELIIEASRPIPSYKDLFIMYCKDIIDLNEYIKWFKAQGYSDDFVKKITQHLYFDLRLFDLYRIYDTVFPDPQWLSSKLQIWGFTSEDAKQTIFSILRRPLRDETRRIVYGLIELAEMGLIDPEHIPDYFKKISEASMVEVKYREHLFEGIREHTFKDSIIYLSDYELNAIKEYVKIRRERYIAREKVRALVVALRRGAITKEQFIEEMKKLGYPEELAKFVCEANAPHYELSIGYILSFADYIELPEDYIEAKLTFLGVPEEDKKIIKEVLKIKPLRDERRRMVWALIEMYEQGLITERDLEDQLKALDLRQEEIKLIKEFARIKRTLYLRRITYRALIRLYQRGKITDQEFIDKMREIGIPENLAKLLLDAEAKTYTLSLSALLHYADYVAIPEEFIVKKLDQLGLPDDEKQIVLQVFKIKPLRDERRKTIWALIEAYEKGLLGDEELKSELNALALRPGEIELLMSFAKLSRTLYLRDLTYRTLIRLYQRGKITDEQFINEMRRIGIPEDLAKKILDAEAKTYTLSLSALLHYADYIAIPEEFLLKKLRQLGLPEDEIAIVLKVFKIKPLRDERRRIIGALLEAYEKGILTDDEIKKALEGLALRPEEIELLITFAKISRTLYLRDIIYRALIRMYRRGKITDREFIEGMKKIGVPEDIAKMLLEAEGKAYTLTLGTLLSYADYVPIPEEFIQKKLEQLGLPEDEKKIVKQVFKVRPIRDERERIFYDLVDAYAKGYLTDQTLKDILTKLGYTPVEVELRMLHAKFRRESYVRYLRERTLDLLLEYNLITPEEYKEALKEMGMTDEMIMEKMQYILARKERKRIREYRVRRR